MKDVDSFVSRLIESLINRRPPSLAHLQITKASTSPNLKKVGTGNIELFLGSYNGQLYLDLPRLGWIIRDILQPLSRHGFDASIDLYQNDKIVAEFISSPNPNFVFCQTHDFDPEVPVSASHQRPRSTLWDEPSISAQLMPFEELENVLYELSRKLDPSPDSALAGRSQGGRGMIMDKSVAKTTFKLNNKSSVSLASIYARKQRNLAPSSMARLAGFRGKEPAGIHEIDQTSVLIETNEPEELAARLAALPHTEGVGLLGGPFVSAQIGSESIEKVLADEAVHRVQTKKQSQPNLIETLPEIGLLSQGTRQLQEDGTGVLIGVVDTGFDLSHPAFRDASGKVRVEALLDQTNGGREYTQTQLESGWSGNTRPGADAHGHGTHVASIASGSRFGNYEGVAPGARLLLVKTDFINTDDAVRWIFSKAGNLPCVVNLSYGHHFGAHDGSDLEERLHRALSGCGRIIVIAAGNERNSNIHIGARFLVGEVQTVRFDVRRQQTDPTGLTLTLWYDQRDWFDVEVITPFGQALLVPTLGNCDVYQTQTFDLELASRRNSWNGAVQIQISLSFKSFKGRLIDRLLEGWQLRITCRQAIFGRIDGWMNNSGSGVFAPHPLVESTRTVSIPATGKTCIAVASYVSRAEWQSDQGPQFDQRVLCGRSSPFSSQGPTRDGRWKPDLAAPGQYLSAALADLSEFAESPDRSQVNERLVTIEGTSMAAPVVAGAVALLLQRDPALTPERAQTILAESTQHDGHTGVASWTTDYGHGKLDLVKALGRLA